MFGETDRFGAGAGGRGDVVQAITDTAEDLLVTVLEEVRERPSVAVAVIAGVFGALIGIGLAVYVTARRREKARPASQLEHLVSSFLNAVKLERSSREFSEQLGRGARKARRRSTGILSKLTDAGDVAELVPLAVQLLENPVVRSYVRKALASRLLGSSR